MYVHPQVEGILGAYGYVRFAEDRAQHKVRFQREEGGGFVDVWDGRKGLTVGIYDPKTQRMGFIRQASMKRIEDALILVTKDL